MIKGNGKMLTAEDSARLAVLGSVKRQELIERLAKRLRDHEQVNHLKIGANRPKREAR